MKSFLFSLGCLLTLTAVCPAAEDEIEVAVGKPAPDITLTGIDGEQFKLSQIFKGGKRVGLMFSRAHW